jgi:GNAT superfamily N-acetyltransferase
MVHVDTWRSAYKDIVPPEVLESMSYGQRSDYWKGIISKKDREGIFLVAEEETNGVVGFCVCGRNRDEDLEFASELYAIYVTEVHQGHGIGRALFQEYRKWMLDRGMTSMIVWVLRDNRYRRFYEAMGGEVISERMISIGETELPEVAYGWQLGVWGESSSAQPLAGADPASSAISDEGTLAGPLSSRPLDGLNAAALLGGVTMHKALAGPALKVSVVGLSLLLLVALVSSAIAYLVLGAELALLFSVEHPPFQVAPFFRQFFVEQEVSLLWDASMAGLLAVLLGLIANGYRDRLTLGFFSSLLALLAPSIFLSPVGLPETFLYSALNFSGLLLQSAAIALLAPVASSLLNGYIAEFTHAMSSTPSDQRIPIPRILIALVLMLPIVTISSIPTPPEMSLVVVVSRIAVQLVALTAALITIGRTLPP